MPKLAIIGASYLQLPLVEKANAMGIETHCFAWPEGAVCKEVANYFYPISILEKEAILESCRKIGIDGITTIATDMAMPTISYVAEELQLVSNSHLSALMSTNKFLMREAFKKNNCSIPDYIEVEVPQANITIPLPVIVKPVDRSGSRGVNKVTQIEELRTAIELAIDESISKRAIIEQYIDGDEISVETISWNGEHYILAITDKVTTGAPHFVEIAHHQPSQLPQIIQEKIKKEVIKCLDALEIKNGAGHAEFKITSAGEVYVIEIGARMGGDFIGSHLVRLSTGYDFLKGVIEVALNTFTLPQKVIEKNSGVYFLSKDTEALLYIFEKNNDFEIEKNIFNKQLKKITNSNDRSGYLIYQADSKIELL